jgi:hypothetical protein
MPKTATEPHLRYREVRNPVTITTVRQLCSVPIYELNGILLLHFLRSLHCEYIENQTNEIDIPLRWYTISAKDVIVGIPLYSIKTSNSFGFIGITTKVIHRDQETYIWYTCLNQELETTPEGKVINFHKKQVSPTTAFLCPYDPTQIYTRVV